MASEFIARKTATYRVVCTSPDVCKVPKNTPVPFPIQEMLSSSTKTSTKTFANGCEIFTYESYTTKVTGDQPGVKKGVKSGTVGEVARPVEYSYSVYVEGVRIVRVNDACEMNEGNTMGKVVYAPPPKADKITDEGKIDSTKDEFAKGMCAQLELSDEACAKMQTSDYWGDLAEEYKKKGEDLYDQTAEYYKNHTSDEIVADLNNAINDGKEAVTTIANDTMDYYKNTPNEQIVADAKDLGGKVVDVGGEIVADAWDWAKGTYDNLSNSESAAEAGGILSAATMGVVNPVKKIEKLSEGIEKIDKSGKNKANKETEPKEGGSVRGIRKKRVKCFCPKDDAKGGREEYDRQLKDQQDGLNSMSADDYIANRQGYSGKDICGDGYKDGKTRKRDGSVTKDARKDRLEQKTKEYRKEYKKKGLGSKKSKSLGQKKAQMELGSQAATHTPDLGAGGEDVISMMGDVGFGDTDVNSHIGSQWNGDRVSAIDAQACEAKKAKKGKEKMNVELKACGKKQAKKMGCDKKNRDRRKQKGLW